MLAWSKKIFSSEDGSENKNWKWVALAAAATPVAVAAGVYVYRRSTRVKRNKSKKPDESLPTSDLKTDVVQPASSTELSSPTVTMEEQKFIATTQQNAIESAEDKDTDSNTDDDAQSAGGAALEDLTEEKREELALGAKTRGNKYYAARKFEKAIELYTKAIGYYPVNDPKTAVFFSNRAACWANMNQFDHVIEDCGRALAADPRYVKAILRRAHAYEKQENFEESLHDFTVACIIEEFKVQTTVEAADRALHSLAAQRTAKFFATKKQSELPSLSFVSAYLNSFRYEYLTDEQRAASNYPAKSGDAVFVQAVEAYRKKQWEKAHKLCNKAVEAVPETFTAEALNMRGTFAFLMGDSEAAKKDFEQALTIKPNYINVFIKMASICVECGSDESFKEALEWFEKAFALDSADADLFYHRAQIYFLIQDYARALGDYEQSIAIDPNFLYAKIQRAVVQYRLGHPDVSEKLFQEAKTQFPQNADVYYYAGEILLDQQRVDDSIREFDRAIRLNSHLPLPHLNKGVIYFHLKNDFERAIECIQKAIEVDSRCDLAYMHLAQMYMQQGRLDEAIITYKRACELARTSADFQNSAMGLEAARAQLAAVQRLGKPTQQ